MVDFQSKLKEVLENISSKKPLIFSITNYVTILDVAQGIRDCGALPVMWYEQDVAEQLAGIASALYLNMGTLSKESYKTMVASGRIAKKRGIPVVVDIVAAGATELTTNNSKKLLEDTKVDIVKGNKGEISAICGGKAEVRGVEAMSHEDNLLELMKDYSKEHEVVLVASGAVDYVTDGRKSYLVKNGSPEMGLIVGSGCVSSAIVAAFSAVQRDYGLASALAMSYFGIAGERASKISKLTGTFKCSLFDNLFSLAQKKDVEGVRIDEG
jgi:hydroxyethylthiazole kinase